MSTPALCRRVPCFLSGLRVPLPVAAVMAPAVLASATVAAFLGWVIVTMALGWQWWMAAAEIAWLAGVPVRLASGAVAGLVIAGGRHAARRLR